MYAEVDGQPTDTIGFTAGVRYDRTSVIDSNISPRAALFFQKPEKYGFKLLYAQGFRNPSAYEAFFTDGVSFAKPNNLQAEKIKSYEAVVWAKPTPGLSLRLSGFYWDATGIVEALPDPKMPDNGCPSCLQFPERRRVRQRRAPSSRAPIATSDGWYAMFGGGAYADVGSTDVAPAGSHREPVGALRQRGQRARADRRRRHLDAQARGARARVGRGALHPARARGAARWRERQRAAGLARRGSASTRTCTRRTCTASTSRSACATSSACATWS